MRVKSRKIDFIIIHHSASDQFKTTPKMITSWHVKNIREKLEPNTSYEEGMQYHVFINGYGELSVRHVDLVLYHVKGMSDKGIYNNYRSLGICLSGNFEKDIPTNEQLKTLDGVLKTHLDMYDLTIDDIFGHYELNKTLCPGKNLKEILIEMKKKLKGGDNKNGLKSKVKQFIVKKIFNPFNKCCISNT